MLVVAFVGCVGALARAQESDATTALEAYQLAVAAGEQYLVDEDYKAAIKAYTEATKVQGFGQRPEALIGRGDAYRLDEQFERALGDYNVAFQAMGILDGPAQARLQYGRGKLYLDIGQIGLAAQDLQAAYDTNSDNTDYLFALGKAYAIGGAGKQAEELMNKFIEQDDQNAEAYALRGRAFAAQQKFDLSLADLERAIELDGTDSDTFLTLGIIRYQQQEYGAATEALGKAIELFEPKEDGLPFTQAFLTKAAIHEDAAKATDDIELAETELRASIDTCNELLGQLAENEATAGVRSAALFRRGVGERLLGQFADAVRSLTAAINANPEMAEAYFRRGICWFELEEAELAVTDFERAQNIEYDNPRYYLWEGLAEATKGDFYKAIESYNEAISLSNRYVDAYMNRARAFMKLGDYQQAIEDFNQCIGLEPTKGRHYFERGIACALADQPEMAIRSFTNAINFEPNLIDSYEWLARELDKTGKGDLATEYRSRAAELKTGE